MSKTAISISLHEGTLRKTFSAEVVDAIGNPVKDTAVDFLLGGHGSLSVHEPVAKLGSRTDGLGRANVSYHRMPGDEGLIEAHLTAECNGDTTNIMLHLVEVARIPGNAAPA